MATATRSDRVEASTQRSPAAHASSSPALNTINGRDAFNDCVGSVEAYGFNLFLLAVPPGCSIGGNGATAWGQISLQTIGPLQNNRGPTFTHVHGPFVVERGPTTQ